MSRKEVPRAGLLKAALAWKISNAQGAQALNMSIRQFQRCKVRFGAGARAACRTDCGAGRRPAGGCRPTCAPAWPRCSRAPMLWHRLLGGQCLSLADYVVVTGTRGGANRGRRAAHVAFAPNSRPANILAPKNSPLRAIVALCAVVTVRS